MNKICAVIPAYNEGKKLAFILEKIKGHNVDAIVIDDGSTDNTAAVAENKEAHLIRHAFNEGKGRALRDGFRSALEKGYDFIITLDADGQHDADEIPTFINKIRNGKAGIIVGNRLRHPVDMPSGRLFINKYFSKITSKVCKQNIPDALCGYRIIKKQALAAVQLNADKFDIDPEILIKIAKAGFAIDSIDIKCVYAEESSHIKPLQDGNNFFRLIAREVKNNKN